MRNELSPSAKANLSGRFWCVENFTLMDVLTEPERDKLQQYLQHRDYKAGEAIYFPGDPSDTVYVVHHGHVRLSYLDPSGRRLTFAIVGPGHLFGETALAGEEQRLWLAEAIEDSKVCSIHKDDLLSLAQSRPILAMQITKKVGERLTEVQNKLEDILFKGVHARLSQALLKLSEQYGEESKRGISIRFRLTHQELANLIGATRETTSLALGDLERQGLLSKERGRITLKDLKGLRELR